MMCLDILIAKSDHQLTTHPAVQRTVVCGPGLVLRVPAHGHIVVATVLKLVRALREDVRRHG